MRLPCFLPGPYPPAIGNICGPPTKIPTPTELRSKSRPNANLLNSWAGMRRMWQTRHPPLAPPKKTKMKVQVSAKRRHFVKQLVCSLQDLCVCADTAKNNCLDLCWIIVEGVRGNMPVFEKLWRTRAQVNYFWWNSVVNFSCFATKKIDREKPRC